MDCKHCPLDGRQSTYIGETGKYGQCSKTAEVKAESAFYKRTAYAHPEFYNNKYEHSFEVLKVFKYPHDRQVGKGAQMVVQQGVLLNSKIIWFSPFIVRTIIEKVGAEMAHQPAIVAYSYK